MPRKLPPMHPGEVLREEFMQPLGLSAYKLAELCLIPRTRIERVVREEVGITTDTALRLGEFFGTTPEFWLRLQERYDIETQKPSLAEQLRRIHKMRSKSAAAA